MSGRVGQSPSYLVHQQPVEGMECAICMSDITMENYVEYRNSNRTLIKYPRYE